MVLKRPPATRLWAACAAALFLASPIAAGGLRALAPDHARVQFAGGQGLLSAGAGYGFLRGRIQAEALYGYVPSVVAGRDLHALSQKTTVAPLRLRVSRAMALYPVVAGWSASVALGEGYELIQDDRFRDYYWPSALRIWFFGGTRARLRTPGAGPLRAVSAVAEVGAQDAYWQAWMHNESLGLGDILSLSLAVQAHFEG